MIRFPSLSSFPTLLTAAAATSLCLASAQERILAVTGEPAPGAPFGADFSMLGSRPVINEFGSVVFGGEVRVGLDPRSGIWQTSGSFIRLISLDGDPGPDPGTTFSGSPQHLGVSDLGAVAFLSGFVSSSGFFGTSLFLGGDALLRALVSVGDPAPGAASGVTFRTLQSPRIDLFGDTTFLATLEGPGINASNQDGIWRGSESGLQLVAREGDNAPDLPLAIRFDELTLPAIDRFGRVAFGASVTGPGVVPQGNDYGMWRERSAGALELLARAGDSAPGFIPQVVFRSSNVTSPLFRPLINDNRRVAFMADITGPTLFLSLIHI